ncbi:kinase-like domain-containing protein [Rhizophagus clarus]|uniref:Kinase-like domain-containing protein n=1 Tax=Rhizophagus clarus TaxID=94130 RepID=A0A8H3LWN6_9GLOM|nr:kinase-like domain-containing protein [Rhizophagus clarus]
MKSLKKYITDETNKDERVNNLIHEMQLEIDDLGGLIFEWIPYYHFDIIKELGENTFEKYIQQYGRINYDKYKDEYIRIKKMRKLL